MAQWVGRSVSIECSNHVTYQGVVSSINHDSSTVTLDDAFKNGKPCGTSVVLASSQILDLAFVQPTLPIKKLYPESSDDDSSRASSGHRGQPHHHKKPNASRALISTEPKQPEKATVVPLVAKPRRRSNSLTSVDFNHKGGVSDNYQSDSKSSQRNHRGKNPSVDCFAVSVESCQGDFDFETNLALFNKEQVFGEIENGKRTPSKHNKQTQANYKHDQMVLKQQSKPVQQIKLLGSSQHASGFYTTDDGLLIPCIDLIAREKLFQHAAILGFTDQRRVDIVGRNTSDMVFQLIGGSSRLNPQNAHQRPTVVVLAGSHIQGCYGVACARHLANHNVNTIVFSPEQESVTSAGNQKEQLLDSELKLYSMSGSKTISDAQGLPTCTVDLIINCLDGSSQVSKEKTTPWYRYIANWCNTSRAHVLAIDPPVEGCLMETKWSVHIGLPQMLDRQSAGQTYLCDIGLPRNLFKSINVSYRSPFGVKFCIPLHPQ